LQCHGAFSVGSVADSVSKIWQNQPGKFYASSEIASCTFGESLAEFDITECGRILEARIFLTDEEGSAIS
jgi:hypothetical protein